MTTVSQTDYDYALAVERVFEDCPLPMPPMLVGEQAGDCPHGDEHWETNPCGGYCRACAAWRAAFRKVRKYLDGGVSAGRARGAE